MTNFPILFIVYLLLFQILFGCDSELWLGCDSVLCLAVYTDLSRNYFILKQIFEFFFFFGKIMVSWASADLEVQLVQLNHCDGVYSNYWNTLLRNLKLLPYIDPPLLSDLLLFNYFSHNYLIFLIHNSNSIWFNINKIHKTEQEENIEKYRRKKRKKKQF